MMLRKSLFFAAPVYWYVPLTEANGLLLENDAAFPDRTLRNRFVFTGKTGVQQISIPLQADSRKLEYKKVEIAYQERWQSHLINALRTAYGKSPFFEFYDYRFEPLIRQGHRFLWDLNMDLLKLSLDCLKLSLPIQTAAPEAGVASPEPELHEQTYYQVFGDVNGFVSGLSILDLLFNEGVNAPEVLRSMQNNQQNFRQIQ